MPLEVKVCILYPPLVVILPPVGNETAVLLTPDEVEPSAFVTVIVTM